MKAVVFRAPFDLSVDSVPDPKPGAEEALIKVGGCGVCGTDVHVYLGEWAARFPLIPGHEFSGTIVALGEGTGDLHVGQAVAVLPVIYCGYCRACRANRWNLCENMLVYGADLPGAFAEYVAVHRSAIFPIDGLSLDEGAVVEPVSCGIHAFKQIGSCLNQNVLVFGCGTQGSVLLQLARLYGAAHITAVDVYEKKLAIASELGADQVLLADDNLPDVLRRSGPFDLVIDATGVPKVVQSLFDYVVPGGKMLLFGVCPPDATLPLSPFQVFRREVKIFGSFSLGGAPDFSEAIGLMQACRINVRPILTHRYPLEGFSDALAKMQRSVDSAKILIVPA
jgi:2-desacetyl-2-hydroxyethyl bacteriochlorophyllide A dehydrogenase